MTKVFMHLRNPRIGCDALNMIKMSKLPCHTDKRENITTCDLAIFFTSNKC